MSESGAIRYALWGSVIAILAAATLMGLSSSAGMSMVRWSLLGWLVMALPGVALGARAVALHGRPGTAFLAVLVTCILSRLFAAAAGAAAAVPAGREAVWAYVAGLAAGFIPVQVFEVGWFYMRSRKGP